MLAELEKQRKDEMLMKLNQSKQKLKVNDTDPQSELDIVFIRDFVVPYLSDVYHSLDKID
jgi:Ca2+-binding EF-hand superfamily protein